MDPDCYDRLKKKGLYQTYKRSAINHTLQILHESLRQRVHLSGVEEAKQDLLVEAPQSELVLSLESKT